MQVKVKLGLTWAIAWEEICFDSSNNQGMEFLETAEVDVDLGAMGIRTSLPVLDRYSPLSYSIAQYVHWDLSVHRGAEACARVYRGNWRELSQMCYQEEEVPGSCIWSD